MRQRGLGLAFKKVVDRVVAAAALVALAPIIALLALIVRSRLGSPVFFRQKRPGLHGRIFEIVKLRTMTDARDATGKLLPDAERLTKLGRLLRATSVDELPQLWNVVKGDLSLVGPRPLLPEYLELYTPAQARRHEVLPGITGWAQVNGRNALTWEEKFDLDLHYVDTWSLRLDALILFRTFLAVLRMGGVSNSVSATMPPFQGSREASRPAKAACTPPHDHPPKD